MMFIETRNGSLINLDNVIAISQYDCTVLVTVRRGEKMVLARYSTEEEAKAELKRIRNMLDYMSVLIPKGDRR